MNFMINISDKDHEEIIAIQIDNDIYFGQLAIAKVREIQRITRVHSRAVFKFMAEMDLGARWKEYSEFPTIFTATNEYRNFIDKFNQIAPV